MVRKPAEGLVLQSGMEGVTIQNAHLGQDSLKSKEIYVETKVKETTQTQVFYVIPGSSGSLLVETGGYVKMPETAEMECKEMLDSFTLTLEQPLSFIPVRIVERAAG